MSLDNIQDFISDKDIRAIMKLDYNHNPEGPEGDSSIDVHSPRFDNDDTQPSLEVSTNFD